MKYMFLDLLVGDTVQKIPSPHTLPSILNHSNFHFNSPTLKVSFCVTAFHAKISAYNDLETAFSEQI
jgi:hypothetical protein